MTAIETDRLTKKYGEIYALDNVSISIPAGEITGLLGRNGAGKTTLMQVLTGQIFASSGTSSIFGEPALENAAVLARTCFIQEAQRYPDGLKVKELLPVLARHYPNWDDQLAQRLIADFRLPTNRAISKKLSRGQLSALGIIIGMASRANLTFFDEPYLGLDAVSRQVFYDRLLEDFSEHPRTILMSTHHIDEAANLLQRVVVLDSGKVLLDADTESLRGRATQVTGRAEAVDAAAEGLRILHQQRLGALTTAAVLGDIPPERVRALEAAGGGVDAVSLQDLIVFLTNEHARETEMEAAR